MDLIEPYHLTYLLDQVDTIIYPSKLTERCIFYTWWM